MFRYNGRSPVENCTEYFIAANREFPPIISVTETKSVIVLPELADTGNAYCDDEHSEEKYEICYIDPFYNS